MNDIRPRKVSALDSHRTESLTSLVQREIEQMIINGELLPGERINEHALAERFQVSRGPIREALRGLEKARLVRVIANRGSFVREISPDEAVEIQETRGILFSHAVAALAGKLTATQKRTIESLIRKIDDCDDQDDLRPFRRLNFDLHRAIVTFAGNERLTEIYIALSEEALLVRFQYPRGDLDIAEANEEHRDLLRALESGDAARARQLAEQHAAKVDRHLERIRMIYKSNNHSPEKAAAPRSRRRSA